VVVEPFEDFSDSLNRTVYAQKRFAFLTPPVGGSASAMALVSLRADLVSEHSYAKPLFGPHRTLVRNPLMPHKRLRYSRNGMRNFACIYLKKFKNIDIY
jgi:hypothetical protein